MSPRLAVAIPLGAVVTLGLFWLMQILIDSGKEGKTEEESTGNIEFVRLDRQEELNTKKRLPKRSAHKDQPPPPPINPASMPKPRLNALDVGGPSLDMSLMMAGGPDMSGVAADTGAVPIVRIQPLYPARAQTRGTEGWVLVEFTITKAGTVADPRVIEADPPSVFNRAALKAIRRWKYKPKIVDGKPVDQVGQTTIISFEIEDKKGRKRR